MVSAAPCATWMRANWRSSTPVERPAAHHIAARRGSEHAAEHGGKRRHALIASLQRDIGHRLPLGKLRQACEDAGLLAPCGEADAGLLAELPGEGAPAHR